MPDDDTHPDLGIFDSGDDAETPTSPELPFAKEERVTCPKCKGEGWILHAEHWGTRHKAVGAMCTLCNGKKKIHPHVLAEHHAIRQGRPPPKADT